MDHINLDEVVLKCTLDGITQTNHVDILAESQNLKLLHNPEYIAQVKEEIIEYNPHKQ